MLHALELDLVERCRHCNLLQPTAGTVAMADTAGMVGMATPGRVTHTHLGKQIGRARARWRPLRHAPFHHHERSGSVSSAGVTCGHTCGMGCFVCTRTEVEHIPTARSTSWSTLSHTEHCDWGGRVQLSCARHITLLRWTLLKTSGVIRRGDRKGVGWEPGNAPRRMRVETTRTARSALSGLRTPLPSTSTRPAPDREHVGQNGIWSPLSETRLESRGGGTRLSSLLCLDSSSCAVSTRCTLQRPKR